MINKVALYLRKSREDEELKKDTLARHEKMLTEYCARYNLHISKVYKEVVSGENIANRPKMQALLDDVAAGLYDGVVCVEIERLSRGNQIDQCEILDVFKNSNTKIYTLQKVYDLSKDDIDEEYFEFALFMSRREYKTITRRMQRGRSQATKEGYYIGSKLPYGFDKVKKDKGYVLVPNPHEAEVVKFIFDKYIAGFGAQLIANQLNEKGIKTRNGKYWYSPLIIQIIKNKAYIGFIHSSKNKEWHEGKHEAIIDLEIFERAQAIIQSKAPKVRKTYTLKNPLAGLCRCGSCGNILQRNIKKQGTVLLQCENSPNYCRNKTYIKFDTVEKEILAQLKNALKDFNYFLDNSQEEIAAQKNSRDNEIKLLTKELKAKEEQIERACDLLETGVYSIDLFKKRTSKLEIDLTNIKERLKEIEETPIYDGEEIKKTIPILEKVLDKYPTLTIEQKNKLLRAIIKRVDISKIDGVFNIDLELLV